MCDSQRNEGHPEVLRRTSPAVEVSLVPCRSLGRQNSLRMTVRATTAKLFLALYSHGSVRRRRHGTNPATIETTVRKIIATSSQKLAFSTYSMS